MQQEPATNLLDPRPAVSPSQEQAAGETEATQNDSPPVNSEGEPTSEVDNTATDDDTTREEDPRLAEKLALLMRREKAILQKERALKERLRSDPEFLEFQKFKKAREAETPDEALSQLGWDYEKLIRHKLGEKEKEPTQEERLQQRIDALEAKLSEREELEQKSKHEKVEAAALQQIQKELQANEDDFELTLLNNAHSLVYDVIKEHHSSTGEVMPIAQAAKAVESYLEQETEKLSKSKKLRKRFVPDEPVNTEPEQQESSPQGNKAQPATITSKAIQSGSVDDDADDDWLDDEASKRRIAEKWKAGHYNRG